MLIAREAGEAPPRVRVTAAQLLVGREPGNDLVLADSTVSRRHARLGFDGHSLSVEDLTSSGGTFVNGARVQRCELRPGDALRFGPRVEFEVATEVEATTSSFDLATLRRSEEPDGLRQLQGLLDVARALNAATVLDEVFQTVLSAAVKLLAAERGFLFLSGTSGGRASFASHPLGLPLAERAAEGSLLARAIASRKTLKETAGRAAAALDQVATPLLVARRPLGSGLEASFIARVEVIGGLLLERAAKRGGFPQASLAVLESLAADAATAIDSAQLYREARDKAKFEHEMGLARTIQAALLTKPQELPFAQLFAHFQPAQRVGGDLYHSALRADGSLAVALGDVSGKGVAASLLMALVQGLLGLLHDLGQPLGELLPVLNRNLHARNPGNRFLTLGAGLLAPDGRLLLANAGHCPLAIVRAGGGVESIRPTGPVLGLLPAGAWRVEERRLSPGDALVIYSDGVSESTAPDGRELEVAGVERALAGMGGLPPESIGALLLETAARHRAGREPGDDLTVLVVRYRKPAG